jgi:hypothetical protein
MFGVVVRCFGVVVLCSGQVDICAAWLCNVVEPSDARILCGVVV